jgi:SAM-dependent methyltransferase
VKYYFQTGADSAAKFLGVLRELYPGRAGALDVLEFAAGYGCVTRHLARGGVPPLNLVSCDIHAEALGFLRDRIGVPVTASERVPENFLPDRQFDVVFALSFFSHMPKSTFGRWLRALFRTLRAPGYLVFTTQGLEGAKHIGCREIPADGYWFAPASEQKDLNTADYGSTLALPRFVIGEIYRELRAPIAMYRYACWWDTQDLWVVAKTGPELPPPGPERDRNA